MNGKNSDDIYISKKKMLQIGMSRHVLDKLETSPSIYHSIDVDRIRKNATSKKTN